MILCARSTSRSREWAQNAARTCKSFVYSIVKITRLYDYQTWRTYCFRKFRRCAKVYGLFSWLCFLDGDWLSRRLSSHGGKQGVNHCSLNTRTSFRLNALGKGRGEGLMTCITGRWSYTTSVSNLGELFLPQPRSSVTLHHPTPPRLTTLPLSTLQSESSSTNIRITHKILFYQILIYQIQKTNYRHICFWDITIAVR